MSALIYLVIFLHQSVYTPLVSLLQLEGHMALQRVFQFVCWVIWLSNYVAKQFVLLFVRGLDWSCSNDVSYMFASDLVGSGLVHSFPQTPHFTFGSFPFVALGQRSRKYCNCELALNFQCNILISECWG